MTRILFPDCEFSIRLLHEPSKPRENNESIADISAKKGNNGTGKSSETPKQGNSKQQIEDVQPGVANASQSPLKEKVFPDAFGLDKLRLRLKENGSEKLKGSFLPFTSSTHYCTVVFEDKEYGQFVYEMVGEVTLPAVFSEHRFTVGIEKNQVGGFEILSRGGGIVFRYRCILFPVLNGLANRCFRVLLQCTDVAVG